MRSARACLFLLIALPAIGCNSAKPTPSGKAPVVNVEAAKAGGGTAAAQVDAAAAEAGEFLKLLTSGNAKAAVEKVAVSFRKEVSGSLTFEEEKKLGYSNTDTEKYLRDAAAGAEKAEITRKHASPSGREEASLRGSLTGKETRLFSIRMAKEGGAWKVTRFIAGRVLGSGFPTDSGTLDLSWARETGLDFLDALVGSSDEQTVTMTLMTEELKARLPAPSVADAGLKYAKKDVRDWLNKNRQSVKGYAINGHAIDTKGATFNGDLVGNGKSAPFTMLLVKQGEDWKVEAFDVK